LNAATIALDAAAIRVMWTGKPMGLTSITNIPRIMRVKGWLQGALLLEKWFAGPSATKPSYSAPDLTTIKMDWALGFPRAKDVFDAMVTEKVWSRYADARIEMAKSLGTLVTSAGGSFDLSSKSTPDLHALHNNHRPVSNSWGLDGMDAALGEFSIYVSPLVFSVDCATLAPA
jgi:uncharacterized protein DUF6402